MGVQVTLIDIKIQNPIAGKWVMLQENLHNLGI